jgi:hypothetical protein
LCYKELDTNQEKFFLTWDMAKPFSNLSLKEEEEEEGGGGGGRRRRKKGEEREEEEEEK